MGVIFSLSLACDNQSLKLIRKKRILGCIIGPAPSRGFRNFRPRWTLGIARSAHMQGANSLAGVLRKTKRGANYVK